MLELKNITKCFQRPVLNHFSFSFPDRGLFLIRGSSGIGKTTLLRIIAGLEKPDEGEITLSDDARISFVFQEPRLVPHLSVLENVLLVGTYRDEKKATEILRVLGLEDAKDQKPESLSGGMKLRVGVARSLYYGGNIYLWDEPTKELDPENRKIIRESARRLAKDHLVLAVSHDPEWNEENMIEL